MSRLYSQGYKLLAATPVNNPVEFTTDFTRIKATIWFTILVGFLCAVLAIAFRNLLWVLFAAVGLGIGVIVITNGPLLDIGNSMRQLIQSMTDASGNASAKELLAGALLTVLILVFFVVSVSRFRVKPTAANTISCVVFAALFFTSPGLQALALGYADNIVVPIMSHIV